MEKYLSVFRTSPFFAAMTDEEIIAILGCLKAGVLTYKRGDYILRAGTSTPWMGMVLDGTALIVEEDVWGHRHLIDKLESGHYFGEVFAATPGSVLTVSVVAESDCSILSMDISRMLLTCPTTCSHHAQLIRNFVSVLAQKSLRQHDKASHLSKRTTREKLLSYLSAEAERQGSLHFTLPYNRTQLADYLCVDRAAMSTTLSSLQREGLLRYDKNNFTLIQGECS